MSPVFGFNTDIRYADTVYHVQTEAHEAELMVQTAIFVRGRCIDKQETSYASEAAAPGFSESAIHQILTQQHKMIVNFIREGKLDSLGSRAKASVAVRTADAVNSSVGAETAIPSKMYVPPASAIVNETAATGTDDDILGVSSSTESWPMPSPQPVPVEVPKAPVTPIAPANQELKLEWLSSESAFKGDSVVMKYRLTLRSRGIEGAKLVARLEVSGVPSAYARTVTDCEGEAEVALKVSAAAKASNAISITVQATHAGQSTARRFRLSSKS